MHWIHLIDESQLQRIVVRSQEKPQVIFKYSTQCELSEAIFNRLQKDCCPDHVDFYFLDLANYQPISDKVSEKFQVAHRSPQVLLINHGECIFDESDRDISLNDILNHLPVVA